MAAVAFIAASRHYAAAMTVPSITTLYAALSAALLIALSLRVIAVRRRDRIALGDGGDPDLMQRIRAQGNFVEYVPMALIVMLLLELQALPAWLLHALGIALIAGRLAHGWALAAGSIPGRVAGMMLTFSVIAIGAAACLLTALGVTG